MCQETFITKTEIFVDLQVQLVYLPPNAYFLLLDTQSKPRTGITQPVQCLSYRREYQ